MRDVGCRVVVAAPHNKNRRNALKQNGSACSTKLNQREGTHSKESNSGEGTATDSNDEAWIGISRSGHVTKMYYTGVKGQGFNEV